MYSECGLVTTARLFQKAGSKELLSAEAINKLKGLNEDNGARTPHSAPDIRLTRLPSDQSATCNGELSCVIRALLLTALQLASTIHCLEVNVGDNAQQISSSSNIDLTSLPPAIPVLAPAFSDSPNSILSLLNSFDVGTAGYGVRHLSPAWLALRQALISQQILAQVDNAPHSSSILPDMAIPGHMSVVQSILAVLCEARARYWRSNVRPPRSPGRSKEKGDLSRHSSQTSLLDRTSNRSLTYIMSPRSAPSAVDISRLAQRSSRLSLTSSALPVTTQGSLAKPSRIEVSLLREFMANPGCVNESSISTLSALVAGALGHARRVAEYTTHPNSAPAFSAYRQVLLLATRIAMAARLEPVVTEWRREGDEGKLGMLASLDALPIYYLLVCAIAGWRERGLHLTLPVFLSACDGNRTLSSYEEPWLTPFYAMSVEPVVPRTAGSSIDADISEGPGVKPVPHELRILDALSRTTRTISADIPTVERIDLSPAELAHVLDTIDDDISIICASLRRRFKDAVAEELERLEQQAIQQQLLQQLHETKPQGRGKGSSAAQHQATNLNEQSAPIPAAVFDLTLPSPYEMAPDASLTSAPQSSVDNANNVDMCITVAQASPDSKSTLPSIDSDPDIVAAQLLFPSAGSRALGLWKRLCPSPMAYDALYVSACQVLSQSSRGINHVKPLLRTVLGRVSARTLAFLAIQAQISTTKFAMNSTVRTSEEVGRPIDPFAIGPIHYSSLATLLTAAGINVPRANLNALQAAAFAQAEEYVEVARVLHDGSIVHNAAIDISQADDAWSKASSTQSGLGPESMSTTGAASPTANNSAPRQFFQGSASAATNIAAADSALKSTSSPGAPPTGTANVSQRAFGTLTVVDPAPTYTTVDTISLATTNGAIFGPDAAGSLARRLSKLASASIFCAHVTPAYASTRFSLENLLDLIRVRYSAPNPHVPGALTLRRSSTTYSSNLVVPIASASFAPLPPLPADTLLSSISTELHVAMQHIVPQYLGRVVPNLVETAKLKIKDAALIGALSCEKLLHPSALCIEGLLRGRSCETHLRNGESCAVELIRSLVKTATLGGRLRPSAKALRGVSPQNLATKGVTISLPGLLAFVWDLPTGPTHSWFVPNLPNHLRYQLSLSKAAQTLARGEAMHELFLLLVPQSRLRCQFDNYANLVRDFDTVSPASPTEAVLLSVHLGAARLAALQETLTVLKPRIEELARKVREIAVRRKQVVLFASKFATWPQACSSRSLESIEAFEAALKGHHTTARRYAHALKVLTRDTMDEAMRLAAQWNLFAVRLAVELRRYTSSPIPDIPNDTLTMLNQSLTSQEVGGKQLLQQVTDVLNHPAYLSVMAGLPMCIATARVLEPLLCPKPEGSLVLRFPQLASWLHRVLAPVLSAEDIALIA